MQPIVPNQHQNPNHNLNAVDVFSNDQLQVIQQLMENQRRIMELRFQEEKEAMRNEFKEEKEAMRNEFEEEKKSMRNEFKEAIAQERRLRWEEMNSFFSIGGAVCGGIGAGAYELFVKNGSLPSVLRAVGTGSIAGTLSGRLLSEAKNRKETQRFPFNR